MDAAQALRRMVEASGLTHRQIETRSGRYGGWVGQTLSRPKPGADLIADVARSCGYRLALVPMSGGDPLYIGEYADLPDGDPIDEARALLARAAALLDEAGRDDAEPIS